MSDLYSEVLVQRQPNPTDGFKKLGLILCLILCIVGYVLVSPLFLLGVIAMCVAVWYFFPRFHVEYEYLLLNDSLDVSVIYSRKKRKEIAQYDLKNLELAAPLTSHRMDYYNSNTRMKVCDYSAGDKNRPPYALILSGEGGPVKVLLQLDRETIENMRQHRPSMVFPD